MTRILHNRIRCKLCSDTIESFHVHDFKWCSCQSVFVDGGREYLRWGGELDNIEDLSEESEEPEPIPIPRNKTPSNREIKMLAEFFRYFPFARPDNGLSE